VREAGPAWWRRGGLAAALICGLAAATWWLIGDRAGALTGLVSLSPADIAAFVARWGMWGVAASLLLMVVHSVVPLPAEVIAVANGMMFGTVGGIAVTWSGAMLGALSAYGLARWLGRPAVRGMISEAGRARIERWTGRADALLVLRLIPLISFNLVNYAAGLAGVGWWRFLWTTAIGILPMTLLTAVLGARIFEIAWPVWAVIAAAVVVLWLAGRRLCR
jgi:uncharacterized membrane protein YdjX (TVP38/TMEM64 family)